MALVVRRPSAPKPPGFPVSRLRMVRGVLLTAMIAQRWTLEPVPGADVLPEPTVTLRPRHGLPMSLRRR